MSLFVLHLLWGWGGLVTGLWPLLRLLGFGLFWSYFRLRRPDALASGRTLSFYRRGFLPWAFVRTWVSRQRSCLGSYLLLEVLLWGLPLSWFLLGGSCHLVVQAPAIFLESYLGFFPLASSVYWWLEVVEVSPWLSTLCSLAVEVVTLVLCQVLVGLPSWCCCASGFLGPVVFLVFTLGHLSQVRSVFLLSHDRDVAFPPLDGFAFGPSAESLPQADAVGFGLRWSARLSCLLTGRYCSFNLGSSSLDLVEGGGFHCVPSPLSSFGMWSPFGVISVFCHYWSPTKVSIGGGFLLRSSLPFRSGVVVFLRPP